MYSLRGAKAKLPPMHTVQRSARDVSIINLLSRRSYGQYPGALLCIKGAGIEGRIGLYIFSIFIEFESKDGFEFI